MSMPAELYDLFKEKLSDAKHSIDGKDVKLLDFVAGKDGLWELAIEAFPKVKDANKDLTSQRDQWSEEKKVLSTKVSDLEKETEALKETQLTEAERKDWLKMKEKGMTGDVEARFNSLDEKVNTLTAANEQLTKSVETERAGKLAADRRSAESNQRTSAITELSKYKIEGPSAELAYTHMVAQRLARVEEKDGGNGKEFVDVYRINKDGKELEATLSSMVKEFADSDVGKRLATGTVAGGSGTDHNAGNPASRQENRPSATQMMASDVGGFDNE